MFGKTLIILGFVVAGGHALAFDADAPPPTAAFSQTGAATPPRLRLDMEARLSGGGSASLGVQNLAGHRQLGPDAFNAASQGMSRSDHALVGAGFRLPF